MFYVSFLGLALCFVAIAYATYLSLCHRNSWQLKANLGFICLVTLGDLSAFEAYARGTELTFLPLFSLLSGIGCLSFSWMSRKRFRTDQSNNQRIEMSEKQYRAIVECQSEFLCRFDISGRLIFFNEAFIRFTGNDSSTLKGRSISEFISQRGIALFSERMDTIALSRRRNTLDVEMIGYHQQSRWFHWTLSPIEARPGIVSEIQAVGCDISESIDYRQDLERFYSISPELMAIIQSGQRFRQINPAFTSMFEWDEAALLSRDLIDFIHPEDQETFEKNVQMLSTVQEISNFSSRFLCKDGSYRLIEWSTTPFPEKDLIYAYGRDITEQHSTEMALRDGERRFRNLFENSPDPIIVECPEKGILDFNSAATHLLKYEPEAIREKTMEMLVPIEHRDSKARSFEPIANGKIKQFEGKILDKDNQLISIELSVSRIYYRGCPSILYHIRNIERRKEAERTLRDAIAAAEAGNRAKSEFLAVMSHEIRTPLNAILGFSQLLHDEVIDEQQRYVERILNGGEHLLSILNDILEYSKIESTGLKLTMNEFSIGTLSKELINVFDARAQEKGIGLNIEIDETIPDPVRGDPQRLKQVLYNLVSNAVKFTEKGGVSVSIRRSFSNNDSNCIQFSISDSGIGIPEDKRELIFRPFTQVDQGIKRIYEGTGLGLAISQKIVNAMNGTIHCSKSDENGSCFTFVIPFEIPLPSQNSNDLNSLQSPQISPEQVSLGLKLLVVEDDHSNSQLMRNLLEKLDCEFDFAFNGKEAVAKAKDTPYDVILMDVAMPKMNGIEATRHILKNASDPKPVILGVSANVMLSVKQECAKAGMTDFFPKPIQYKAFKAFLLRHCQNIKDADKLVHD